MPVTSIFQETEFIQRTLKETETTIISINAFDLSRITNLIFYGTDALILEINKNPFSSLETVTLNEGITKIGENVFVELNTLNILNIPSSVEFIDGGAFQKCYNIEPIISKDNLHICYEDNCFYTIPFENNPKILLTTIARKDKNTYQINKDVVKIQQKAFYGNDFVETIIIPEATTSIGSEAFKECPKLKEIIYKGINDIKIDAKELFDDPEKIIIKVRNDYEGNTLFGIEVQKENPPSSPDDEDDDELNGGQIAGIVIAALLVVVIIGFLVYWFVIRKEKNEKSSESDKQEDIP